MNQITQAPDDTAVRTALWRALHLEVDASPHVFEDGVGLELVAPMLPIELQDAELRPAVERAAAGARANGTPFLSFFTPSEMLVLARAAGFRQVQHVSAAMLAERYFARRTDGLRPPNDSEELLVANT